MKTQKVLFSIVAIFAMTMGCLLGASPAQATEVISDGDTALGIRGLTVRFADGSEAVYDVDFVFRSPQALYGDPPGLFDFFGQGQAEDAVLAANAALNAAGTPLVGSLGNFYYSVGYNYLDSALDGPVVRAAQAESRGISWPTVGRDLEENSSPWGEPDSYAKFVEVTGAECSENADCDDDQFCNGAETCNGGQCQDGTGPCAGGEVCVEDSDECIAVECTSGADCDDGQFCNGAETCDDLGQCVAGTPPCGADEVCVDEDDTCVPPECTGNADCDDGRFCNGAETCDAGQCQDGVSPCEAGEICLDALDGCFSPECSENADCDDGRFCNGLEACVAGRCQDGTRPCGVGEICVEISDTCVEAECIINEQCDDGRFCNGNETCEAGQCQFENTSPCGAGESCEESTDECVGLQPDCRQACREDKFECLDAAIADRKACFELCGDQRDKTLDFCETLPFWQRWRCWINAYRADRQCNRECRSGYRDTRGECRAEFRVCRANCP
jgi:hypothetical protein